MVHSNYPVALNVDYHETTAQYIHGTNLTEECNYKDKNNGNRVYAREPM